MSERIGLLGGTFDPIHIGHLVAAMNAQVVLELDRVLMVVANQPWQKTGTRQITPAEIRLEAVSAAVSELPGIDVSAIEIDRGGDSYSIDTVETLRSDDPDGCYFLIVGSDVAGQLDTWHRHDELQDLVTVAVVERPGSEGTIVPPGWSAVAVPAPLVDLSSTELRERIRMGLPVRYLVPEPSLMIYGHYNANEQRNA